MAIHSPGVPFFFLCLFKTTPPRVACRAAVCTYSIPTVSFTVGLPHLKIYQNLKKRRLSANGEKEWREDLYQRSNISFSKREALSITAFGVGIFWVVWIHNETYRAIVYVRFLRASLILCWSGLAGETCAWKNDGIRRGLPLCTQNASFAGRAPCNASKNALVPRTVNRRVSWRGMVTRFRTPIVSVDKSSHTGMDNELTNWPVIFIDPTTRPFSSIASPSMSNELFGAHISYLFAPSRPLLPICANWGKRSHDQHGVPPNGSTCRSRIRMDDGGFHD